MPSSDIEKNARFFWIIVNSQKLKDAIYLQNNCE
jgi:hypothetical protein